MRDLRESLPLADCVHGADNAGVQFENGIPNAGGHSHIAKRFRAPQHDFRMVSIPRYRYRLRNEQRRVPLKNYRFQQKSRIVDVEHNAWRKRRSKLFSNVGSHVHLGWNTQPVVGQRPFRLRHGGAAGNRQSKRD